MPNESDILRSFVDEESPEDDPVTDAATDAEEESVGITPDDHNTKELDDGGAIIELDDAKDVKKSIEFYSNLAEDLDDGELNSIATKILDLLDKDEIARAERDKQYAEGLQRTGLGKDAPGGASFDGASKVTHPLMLEVAIDFSARAIKELWPADGPVKDKIIGETNDRKEEKAKRKKNYMNWQLTEKMPSVRYELEQILTQVPQGGVAYSKLWYDQKRKTPMHEPVWVDEIRLPWGATNYYKSDRKTHVMMLNDYTFKDRIRSGMYMEIDGVVSTVTDPEQTSAAQANDKIEGKSTTSFNEDGIRRVFEVDIQYIVTDPKRKVDDPNDTDAGPAPYLITIDETTRKVLSVYRNWDENDDNEEALVHMVEWPFLPWRGAMPIGTPQVLGGIAAAATGALRALLDSAHINNFPGGMRLKSGPVGGQSVRIDAGQTNEIDGGVGQDDIRKTFMPTPVNPTSSVLYELLGYLVDAGKEVIKTTLDEANDNANVPVGTTMARIEQGMVVFSAIHSRLHNAMGKFLKVLHRLNATYLDDAQVLKETGEQMAFKADFDAPNDVIPVSDPEIFSELQRTAQMQTVAQRAQLFPQLYDLYKVEEGILKMMKIKDPTQYLKPQPKPTPQHAINENIAAALGQPIVAFPDQDHLAHLQAHLAFIEDPIFGQNPLMAPQAIPAILQNVKEHLLFQYAKLVMDACTEAADGADLTQFQSIKDASVKTAFDQMLAAATQSVHPEIQKLFAQVMPVIQQAQGILKQYQQPPPMDPSQVAMQKNQQDAEQAQAELALKQQQLTQQTSLKQAELQQDAHTAAGEAQVTTSVAAQGNQTKVATTQATNASREKIAQMGDATKQAVTQEDNNTAMEISAAEIEAGKKSQLTDGAGVGGKPRTE